MLLQLCASIAGRTLHAGHMPESSYVALQRRRAISKQLSAEADDRAAPPALDKPPKTRHRAPPAEPLPYSEGTCHRTSEGGHPEPSDSMRLRSETSADDRPCALSDLMEAVSAGLAEKPYVLTCVLSLCCEQRLISANFRDNCGENSQKVDRPALRFDLFSMAS